MWRMTGWDLILFKTAWLPKCVDIDCPLQSDLTLWNYVSSTKSRQRPQQDPYPDGRNDNKYSGASSSAMVS